MNVSLPDQMKSWVESRSEGGRYSNASDYVRDLIRRDQAREKSIVEIQQVIDEGVASGDAEAFNMNQFVANKTNN